MQKRINEPEFFFSFCPLSYLASFQTHILQLPKSHQLNMLLQQNHPYIFGKAMWQKQQILPVSLLLNPNISNLFLFLSKIQKNVLLSLKICHYQPYYSIILPFLLSQRRQLISLLSSKLKPHTLVIYRVNRVIKQETISLKQLPHMPMPLISSFSPFSIHQMNNSKFPLNTYRNFLHYFPSIHRMEGV